jgi:hypothetical protein
VRKLLVSILAAIALLVGAHALPADAATLPPGQYTVTSYRGCSVEFIYGNFGSTAFADLYFRTTGCNAYTSVTVSAVRNGYPVSHECEYVDVVFVSTPGCALLLNPLGIRTTVVGSAYGGNVKLCDEATGICVRRGFSVFG